MISNWVGWLLSGIVLFLLFVIGFMLEKPVRLAILGKRAQGKVVEMKLSKKLTAPVVEFSNSAGAQFRATSRNYTESPSIKVGDSVTVIYNPITPNDSQILMLREFILEFLLLGFITFILCIWISGILISGDGSLDDPFHILPKVIQHLQLSPVRFPLFFFMPIVLFGAGVGAYTSLKSAIILGVTGVKVVGHVNGSIYISGKSSRQSRSSGGSEHWNIQFTDLNGNNQNINQSLALPYSSLKEGDPVEVIYSPDSPELGVVNTWVEIWLAPLVITFFFIAILIFAGLLLTNLVKI